VVEVAHSESNYQERSRQVKKVLWIELVLNLLIAIGKIVLGLWTRCTVIFADGVHSISDGASNIVGLVAMSIASHPADKTHPYGHRKFETIASLIISISLFIAAIIIVKESIANLINPVTPDVNVFSFAIMALTLVFNVGIALWERKRGRELKSDLLIADSWHTFSDIFVTISVLVALIGIKMGYHRLDAIFFIRHRGLYCLDCYSNPTS